MSDQPVAIITGAARGIGAATARALAAEGWRLVLVDRCADDPALAYRLASRADLDAVVDECRDLGRGDDGFDQVETAVGNVADGCGERGHSDGSAESAVGIVADVRDQGALDRAVAEAVDRFGGLDVAVAAAGAISGGRPGWEVDDTDWDAMVGINLEGVWRLARAATPALLARPEPRRGRFVAVASAGASVGLPLLTAYTAAKAGVVGLTRSLAAELGPHGITANAVAPGSTETAMLDASAAVYELENVEGFARHHMLPTLIAPEQVAAAIVWLCSESAGAVTGTLMPVDAGMTAK